MELFCSKNLQWQSQIDLIPVVAHSPFPVLIHGPSGSGKELVAEKIHFQSGRMGKFVRINCSALAENLIESELFGHKKGSFTGAIGDRKGAFVSARAGTIFLDEIGDLPMHLQAKLLRVLENNELSPLGADEIIKVDVRIISATHKNLNDMIYSGQFREDLYYRLNVVSINLPALRQRMEDFEFILFTFARQYKTRFTHSGVLEMKKYRWPGNIRELKNFVARASVLTPSKIVDAEQVNQLLFHANLAGTPDKKVNGTIKQVEKRMILQTLRANRGNQRKTAATLGMPKSTLSDRLKTYGIDSREFR